MLGLRWVVVGEYTRQALSNLHSAALVPDATAAAAVDANASRHLRSPHHRRVLIVYARFTLFDSGGEGCGGVGVCRVITCERVVLFVFISL